MGKVVFWKFWLLSNELEDRTKGSENPGSRSFLRILIWIWTALRIGLKDLDPFLPNQIQIQILNNVHTTNVLEWLNLELQLTVVQIVHLFILHAKFSQEEVGSWVKKDVKGAHGIDSTWLQHYQCLNINSPCYPIGWKDLKKDRI